MSVIQHRYGKQYTVGRRGRATVEGFQDALLGLLERLPWGEVTVKALSDVVGVSPASFYQYLPSLTELALDTEARLKRDKKPVPKHLAMVVKLLLWEHEQGLS